MEATPLTPAQILSLLGAVVLGLALPATLFLPVWLLVTRWWDRWALHRAMVEWQAWQAAHPNALEDDLARRHRLSRQLWQEEQPVYIQAHLLRERLADARRQARVREIMDAEQQGGRDGR
jgi:hypothetical protein